MVLSPGTRFGSYEIIGVLAVGGMGEVYRARDARLNRQVAIKLLPALFAVDPDRLARFEREAQVLASLNHPNIGAIYGLVESEINGKPGVGLVLELVEGRSLDQLIPSTGLPLHEMLTLAAQMADALAAAHAAGVVHRDFKPANVVVTPAGTAKVLDFGLAKAANLEAASGATETAMTPAGSPQTDVGVVMGTICYMSPEQAAGRPIDARSDIFSFGSVLFEMVTGHRAFDCDTSVSTLAAIIHEPAKHVTRLNAAVPRELERLIARCHRKDPTRRVQSMADLRSALEELRDDFEAGRLSGPVAVPVGAPPRDRRPVRMAGAALAVIAVAAAGVFAGRAWFAPAPPSARAMRFDIVTPQTEDPLSFAVSPDGQRIVYGAHGETEPELWVRSLTTGETRPIRGTERGRFPFWSPDGRSLGFFTDHRLYRVDVDGGSPQSLSPAGLPVGGTWGRDGVIVFGSLGKSLQQVSATGGTAAPVRGIAPRYAGHFAPSFLPDGRHFLYYVRGDAGIRGIYVGSLDDEPSRRLFVADPGAVYSNSGHVLFNRDGTVFAARFDAAHFSVGDNPVAIAQGVLPDQLVGLSETGILAFRPAGSGAAPGPGQTRFSIQELDRTGRAVRLTHLDCQSPSLSPDGRVLAAQRNQDGNVDIWLLDVAREISTRLTYDPADDVMAIWSPDGARVVFSSDRLGAHDLYVKDIAGGAERALLSTAQNKFSTDWSRDGRLILFTSDDPKTGLDVWALPADGRQPPFAVVRTPFDETDAQFSPDGKWIAYTSNETGRPEVCVQPFPGPGGTKTIVSTNGGAQPRWRADGRELFYVALDERLMAAAIALGPDGASFEPGTPVPLLRLERAEAVPERQQYVVTREGPLFMVASDTIAARDNANTRPLTILVNWTALLK